MMTRYSYSYSLEQLRIVGHMASDEQEENSLGLIQTCPGIYEYKYNFKYKHTKTEYLYDYDYEYD